MAKLRFNVTMSLDGYVAGPDQSLEHPLGVGGEALHEWALATRSSRATHGTEGGVTQLTLRRALRLRAQGRRVGPPPRRSRASCSPRSGAGPSVI